jgi:hypothetical protein
MGIDGKMAKSILETLSNPRSSVKSSVPSAVSPTVASTASPQAKSKSTSGKAPQTLSQFLSDNGLTAIGPCLSENGIADLDTLKLLTESDLKGMGIDGKMAKSILETLSNPQPSEVQSCVNVSSTNTVSTPADRLPSSSPEGEKVTVTGTVTKETVHAMSSEPAIHPEGQNTDAVVMTMSLNTPSSEDHISPVELQIPISDVALTSTAVNIVLATTETAASPKIESAVVDLVKSTLVSPTPSCVDKGPSPVASGVSSVDAVSVSTSTPPAATVEDNGDLAEFLKNSGLQHLLPNLIKGNIDLVKLKSLPDAELASLGLNMGERLKMKKAIAKAKVTL